MSNPFLPKGGRLRPPKRNKRDLTHQTLFTSDWGKLYPFSCIEVIPGASYRINASVGFRSMQTKFPLQSRIRTAAYFFYVRNRTLCDVWEDFIFKTKGESDGVVSPWLKIVTPSSPNANVLKTGSLGDALGVATTFGSSSSNVLKLTPRMFYGVQSGPRQESWSVDNFYSKLQLMMGSVLPLFPYNISSNPAGEFNLGYMFQIPTPESYSSLISFTLSHSSFSASSSLYYFYAIIDRQDSLVYLSDVEQISIHSGQSDTSFSIPSQVSDIVSADDYNKRLFICSVGSNGQFPLCFRSATSLDLSYLAGAIVSPSDNPHVGVTPSDPLSALPFRAYEQICNYYFRNDLNSPYMLNGEPQYNKFIPTKDGGPDTNVYDFHFHNWELDRFVSAMQTPQFGEAPLVGLTYRVGADIDKAEFTFASDGGPEYHATLGVKDDKVVNIVSADSDLPASNLRNLMSMVDAGFSINTLRDVNSFQRFLENCQRRGLRYRNQVESHFGVKVDYPDIDIPQYIGGFSSWAQVGQVTNMAEMPDAGLGDYVGTLSGMSQSKHEIDCYCPEHGFIIGIYCVYPSPIYSQSEPKYLKKHSPFDYFSPEFGKIGKVPIHYNEISPMQTNNEHKLSDVFGYQVPWYDYLDIQDSAHGDFRTTLRDFIVQRLWDSPPVLSEDFVRVNPTQLNDVFTTRNIADAYGSTSRFLCSALTKVTALLPIPVHGTPSLE